MPSYIDFRYPGIFNLNQRAEMPSSFGPPNMSAMFQSGISALADPLVARMKELDAQQRAAQLAKLYEAYGTPGTTAAPATAAAPLRTSSTAGSPAGDDPGGVMGGRAAGATAAVGDPVAPGLKPYETALLNGIAKPESGGRYDIRYTPRGGATFEETGQHPGIFEPGPEGRSSAAGRYQFTKTTWDRLTGGEVPFTRENQDLMALKLARQDYAARTKRDLDADLQAEGFSPRIQAALSPTWAGLRGNKAQNAAVYNSTLASFTAAPAPAPAPTASFAPTVAPAPTPQAAAAVVAPQGPQQAPQFQPVQTPDRAAVLANHDSAVAAALASGDRARADQLSAMRPAIAAGGGGPAAPAAQPAPQQAQQQQQDPQAAMQQQVVSGVEQGDQVINDRLDAVRQAGQTRVASLDPTAGLAPPRAVPTSRVAPPPDVAVTSSIPMVPPAALPRPAPAASAPTAPAGPAEPPVGPAGVPTPPPPPSPAPMRVAQAQGLPPAVQPRAGDPRAEQLLLGMLRLARTPEEVHQIGQELIKLRQPQELKHGQFKIENGQWLDTATGQTKPLQGGGYPPLTEAEKKTYGIPENTGAFWGPDGKPHVLPGTASTKITVSPEGKGQEKFEEKRAEYIVKQYGTYLEEGEKAQRQSLDLNRLSDSFARVGPQGKLADLKASVGPYLEGLGIDVAGLDDVQTVQSVIERMAPQQRVTGSGSQSDAEYRGFLRSLPTLVQNPETRARLLSMLQAQNGIAQQRGEIAQRLFAREIDDKTAAAELKKLPKHEDVYQQFKTENRELYLQGQRDAMQRRDTGNVEKLREVTERASAPATPTTQAEYDALPSGRHYVDPETKKIKRKK